MNAREIALSAAEAAALDERGEPRAVPFRHIPALDGLRGVAVLTVMVYHLAHLAPGLAAWTGGGFLGVDVFFVLSGFLITSILIKERETDGQIDLKKFYLRRFFRLAPAFWTFLIGIYLGAGYLLPAGQAALVRDPENLFFAFAYLMNWYSAHAENLTGNLNHAWSLAIEEQFYILWSLVLFCAFARGARRAQIFRWTAFSVLALIVWRFLRVAAGAETRALYYSTDARIDALLIGCLAAMAYSWRLLPKKIYADWRFDLAALAALAAALVILFNFSHEDFTLYCGVLSVFSLSIAVLILRLVAREKSVAARLLELRFLRWLGQISYGLYLWHYAFYEFAKKSFDSVPLQIAAGVALALLASAASFYLVEKPFLKLKGRFAS